MRKRNRSILTWLILGLLPLLLIACGGSPEPTEAPQTEVETVEEEVQAVEEEVEAVEEEIEGETAVSDEILPVSAKPQLIEFYADW